MKTLSYSIIALVVLSLSACGDENNSAESEDLTTDSIRVETTESSEAIVPAAIETNSDAIQHLTHQIENFDVGNSNGYPFDTAHTKSAIFELRNSDSLVHYMTWVMAKKHRLNLECCQNAIDLRTNQEVRPVDSLADPYLYEFLSATEQLSKAPYLTEALPNISSEMAIDYIEGNPHLLDFMPISQEYDKILKLNAIIADPDFDGIPEDYYKIYE